ncbi:agmatinase [Paucibacter sp. KCTC 42545]|uniref:agmatinase n=1 Tax=Paucibacter sp. KCTC 42545 TaxID=1768242 RepID=UPI000733ABC4|nr:agmatinase [Paucibacter sp. KCTC 42545]ALT79030.1 agmatinase [Paucibacter sp. KCTC 42545]
MSTFAFNADNAFMKLARGDANKPFGLAGIAWDGCVTNRPGARFGPRAVREASHMLCDGIHPFFNTTPEGQLTDLGDLVLPNTNLDAMRAAMLPLVAPLLAQHHMTWLGGDHSITLPLLRAYRAHYGQPLAVIHFDAHCDTWEDHFGEPSGHGTWVYEAIQEGLVLKEGFVQFGIRSAGLREAREYVADQGGMIFDARSLRGLDNASQLAPILNRVRERMAALGHPPLYLSLDIDCLDPAFAPGTGTPEPGGMNTNQLFSILEELVPGLNFVGMDCVEVAPPYDHAELTSYAAAQLVWTYLCGRIAANKV